MRKYHFLSTVAFACLSLSSFVACANNPFVPKAEVRILDVASTVTGRFVGIRQTASTENGRSFLLYTYSEPKVSIEKLPGYPEVNFNRFSVKVTLSDGTVMPEKDYPLSKGTINAETVEIQFPIMSIDTDLQRVVFPGNNAPRVGDGIADVTIYGVDTNGHSISVPFSVPLRFESLVFSDSPVPSGPASTAPPTAPITTPSASPNV